MRKILSLVVVVWAVSLGIAKAYSMRLDKEPVIVNYYDAEEVCINHQCEAEQD